MPMLGFTSAWYFSAMIQRPNTFTSPLMSTHPRRQGGFTFLWLLFLIAGLGVGMAALGTLWHTAAQREREQQLLFVGDQYRRAIESFQKIPLPAGQQARLPKTFDELLLDPRFNHTVRHLRRAYLDPMTGKVEWGMVKDAQGGIIGVHSLSDAIARKTANFPVRYDAFANRERVRDWVFGLSGVAAGGAGDGSQALAQQAGSETAPISEPTPGQGTSPELSLQIDCNTARIRNLVQCRKAHGVTPSEALTACNLTVRVDYQTCLADGTQP
jgi:type II secretory pathway pseudopilin PulG